MIALQLQRFRHTMARLQVLLACYFADRVRHRDRQREWQRLLTRAGLEGPLPSHYTEAIRQVTAFGDPVMKAR
jgi:hypothetical protein